MRRGSERLLWTAAFSGSLAAHAALAAALALSPVAAEGERQETSIVIHSAPQADAERMERPALEAAPATPDIATLAALDLTSPAETAPLEPDALAQTVDAEPEPVAELVHDDIIAADATAAEADAPVARQDMMAEVAPIAPVLAEAAAAADELEAAPAPDEAAIGTPATPVSEMAAGVADALAVVVPLTVAGDGLAGVGERAVEATVAAPPAAVEIPEPLGMAQVALVAGEARAVEAARPRTEAAPAMAAVPSSAAPPAAEVPAIPSAPSAPSAQAVVPVAPVVPEQTVALARPDEPPVLRPRESVEEAYGKLLGAISGESGGAGCFLALASRDGEAIGVDGFAVDEQRVARLDERLVDLVETPVEVRGHSVSPAQCAALAFAGGLGITPEAPLTVRLATPEIVSGDEMIGLVGNIGRRWFYLLVVDDEGKVQEIENDKLFVVERDTVGFRAPLTLTSGPVETVQLMLAISSDEILEMVWLREGYEAGTYFDHLRAEVQANGGGVDFGIAPFVLRQAGP